MARQKPSAFSPAATWARSRIFLRPSLIGCIKSWIDHHEFVSGAKADLSRQPRPRAARALSPGYLGVRPVGHRLRPCRILTVIGTEPSLLRQLFLRPCVPCG